MLDFELRLQQKVLRKMQSKRLMHGSRIQVGTERDKTEAKLYHFKILLNLLIILYSYLEAVANSEIFVLLTSSEIRPAVLYCKTPAWYESRPEGS